VLDVPSTEKGRLRQSGTPKIWIVAIRPRYQGLTPDCVENEEDSLDQCHVNWSLRVIRNNHLWQRGSSARTRDQDKSDLDDNNRVSQARPWTWVQAEPCDNRVKCTKDMHIDIKDRNLLRLSQQMGDLLHFRARTPIWLSPWLVCQSRVSLLTSALWTRMTLVWTERRLPSVEGMSGKGNPCFQDHRRNNISRMISRNPRVDVYSKQSFRSLRGLKGQFSVRDVRTNDAAERYLTACRSRNDCREWQDGLEVTPRASEKEKSQICLTF
jgi:hypothetical protein